MIVIAVSTAVICLFSLQGEQGGGVVCCLGLEADPFAGGTEAAGAVRLIGRLGLEADPLAGGAEVAEGPGVVGGLGLEADTLAGGGEAARAARLAGRRHTRRV